MGIRQKFGLNVKRYRLEADISQEELAMRINVDQAYISRVETGQINPTLETIAELAEALSISIELLFTKES